MVLSREPEWARASSTSWSHGHILESRKLRADESVGPSQLTLFLMAPSHRYRLVTFLCCTVAKLCLTLWDSMDCSTPGFPVLHHLLEFAQTRVHWVIDAIQPFHPVTLFSSRPQSFPASGSFPMSGLFASVAKVLELQLQHQSSQ